MAQQVIFIGTVADDHTGTKLRLGGDMINDNFTELYTAEALNTAKESNKTHTGEVTGSEALTITDKAVTLAKMNDMATASLIYRRSAGVGVPQVNTLAQLATDLIALVGFLRPWSTVFSLLAGDNALAVVTPSTTKPYSVMFVNASGIIITQDIEVEETISGGFYAYNLYTAEAINNLEIRIVY
jgi:hypothetical protein